MKLDILDEPELEFASGARHIDIRFGLMTAGPLDVLSPRTRAISVGGVGTADTVEAIVRWLERCREDIPAKVSLYPNLFPRFPGFRPDTAFRSTLLLETRTQRAISHRDLARLTHAPRSNKLIEAAVEVFLDEMRYVSEKTRPDVLICAPPFDLWEMVKGDQPFDDAGERE